MSFDFEFTAFLQILWRATWQASVLALIVFCITTILRHWMTPKWRVIMWTLPLARMVLLLVPASGLSFFNLLDLSNKETRPAAVVTLPATIDDRITTNDIRNQGVEQLDTISGTVKNSTTVINSSASPLQKTDLILPFTLSSLLTYIWLLGFCTMICWWVGSQFVLSRIIAKSEKLSDESLLQLIETRRKQYRLKFQIRCFISNTNLGPSLCGFWRPTILLPRNLYSELSNAELHTIINHEIQHIRRWDVLFLFISRLASTIHWFNPIAYFIGNQLRRDIELAVDAATVSTLDEQARHAYGELLIRLSQRTLKPIAAIEMAGKPSALRIRIDQLATPIKESRTRSVISIGLMLILLVTGLSDVAQTQEQKESKAKKESSSITTIKSKSTPTKTQNKYFITGTVREAGTNKPVTDAEIQIFVASEQDINKRVLKGMTNQAGQYRIEVPLGNAQIWFPILKPGYWLTPEENMRNLTTTPEKPVVEQNIVAQTGTVWNIQVKGTLKDKYFRHIASVYEVEDDSTRAAWIKGEPVSFQKPLVTGISNLNKRGRGSITEVGSSGKLMISVGTVLTELVIEPGFDNSQVVSLKKVPDSDSTQMIDVSGKIATIKKATVTLNNGVPLLTFQYKTLKPLGNQKLIGRVMDVDGNPLADVRVGVVSGMKGGGNSDTGEATKTTMDGTFSIEIPVYDISKADNQHFSVVLTKDGFAAVDSHKKDITKDLTLIDFKTLTMAPGFSIPVRVFDEQGKPVPGAIVEPGNAYALRRQITRTTADGRALIKNLPSGVVRASVRWGTKMKQANLVVSKDKTENTEVAIKLNELNTPITTKIEKRKPLAVGQIAPEWDISEWSDGRARKLSEYRDQIVVLYFWSLSSKGAVASIPAQKRLAKHFADQEVVFLGINGAGTEMSQINKLKETEQWKTPTGIDRGTSLFDGVTFKKYGVQSSSVLIVIDADGKISFRSDVAPSQDKNTYIKNLAEASGISWPPPKNATQKQILEIMNQIQFTLLSREVNRVLKAKR